MTNIDNFHDIIIKSGQGMTTTVRLFKNRDLTFLNSSTERGGGKRQIK